MYVHSFRANFIIIVIIIIIIIIIINFAFSFHFRYFRNIVKRIISLDIIYHKI